MYVIKLYSNIEIWIGFHLLIVFILKEIDTTSVKELIDI